MKKTLLFTLIIGCGLAVLGCDENGDVDDDDEGGDVTDCVDMCDVLLGGGESEETFQCVGEELIELGHEGLMENADCSEDNLADEDSCSACMDAIGVPDGDCVDALASCQD